MSHYRCHFVILICVAAILLGCAKKPEETNTVVTSLAQKISIQTLEGVASGFDCAVVEVLCPSTHRAADFTTGIFTDKNQFYAQAPIECLGVNSTQLFSAIVDFKTLF